MGGFVCHQYFPGATPQAVAVAQSWAGNKHGDSVLLASGVLGMAARLSMSSVSRDFLLFPLVSARHTRTCRLGWVRKAYVIYRFIATLHYSSVTGTCSSQGLPPMLMPGRSQAFADPKCYLRALGQGTTHSYILRWGWGAEQTPAAPQVLSPGQ